MAFAGFFCLIGGYSLLKPVRDGVFLQRLGYTRQPEFDVYVALGSLVVVTLYNLVSNRLSRRWLLGIGFAVFSAGIALCAVLLKGGATGPAAIFYVGLNLFWLLLLAIYWSTVNDVFSVDEGRRWYAWVALAGPTGALTGSFLASTLVEWLGSVNLLWVSLAFFAASWGSAGALDAYARRHPTGAPPRVVMPAAVPDPRLLFRSRYVLWIAGIMFLGVFVMKIYLMDFYRLLTEHAAGQDQKTAWAAWRNVGVNVLGVGLQVVVTPILLRRYGPGVALRILPLVALIGGVALMSHEIFYMAFGVIATAEAIAYTVNQSAKELLYVPGDRSLKYQAKALVDVFCFRLGDVAASLVIWGGLAFYSGVFRQTYAPALGLALAAALVWWASARAAGRSFDEATRAGTGAGHPDAGGGTPSA